MQGLIRGSAAVAQNAAAGSYAEPLAPIPNAIERLGMQVNGLDADLTELHNRLHRVLRDPTPAKESPAAGIAAVPVSSQTFQQVEMQTARLEQMSRYVRDILDRLEA